MLLEATPGIGHNQPPLTERITAELAPFQERATQMLAIAETAVIIDEVSASKVTDLVKLMRGLEEDVDKARDAMMRPFLEATRTINQHFNALKTRVGSVRFGDDGRGGLMGMLTVYERKREAEAQAERDRLQAEQRAREAEAEAARRAAEEKRQAGAGSVKDELEALQAEEAADRLKRQADAVRPEPIRSHLGTVGRRREIEFTITDLRKALGWVLRGTLKAQIEQAARTIIGKHLRSLGVEAVDRGVEIPGVSVTVEKVAQVR
jgi:hypothetical protein